MYRHECAMGYDLSLSASNVRPTHCTAAYDSIRRVVPVGVSSNDRGRKAERAEAAAVRDQHADGSRAEIQRAGDEYSQLAQYARDIDWRASPHWSVMPFLERGMGLRVQLYLDRLSQRDNGSPISLRLF